MFETFMQTLRQFFGAGRQELPGLMGAGLMKLAMLGAVPIVVLGLVIWASPAFRQWFRGLAERGGGRAVLAAIVSGLYKVLFVLALLRLVMVALVYQAAVFSHQHGRITEDNRATVQMKWGSPHEQRELDVSFTRKRTWVTRQLKLGGKEPRVIREEYWADEEKPVEAVEGQMPEVISTHREDRDCDVEQRSIRRADVAIGITSNSRAVGKGSYEAKYAGYEDTWQLQYVVANEQEFPVTAHMSFRLPNARDFFNKFRLIVDDKDMLDKVQSGGDDGAALTWDYDLKPGQEAKVEIGYESRGLEHLRYIPKRMTPTAHYRVAMTVNKVPPKQIDYPLGSMPPLENKSDITSAPYTLHWTLDNALTAYDIGFKLPMAQQPNYHVARLLDEAPFGLLLLLLVLVLPRIIVGQSVRLTLLVFFAAAYYLFYTLMGRLVDVIPWFAMAFAISAVVMLGILALYRFRDAATRMFVLPDLISFAVFVVLFPLAVIDAERTRFWMQLFYMALLLYASTTLIRCRVWSSPKPE